MANSVPTLEDVANLASVCKSTASRILAVKQGIKLPFSSKTQDKVRSAADMLGYKPSKLARGLTQTKTGMIGLVVPSVKDSFFPSVTSIIESLLAEQGYNVILSNTSGDSTVERTKVEDLLAWRVDGLIIAPSQEAGDDAGLIWELWRNKVPFVLIDRSFPQTPFCAVITDDRTGGMMAVEHLLEIGRKTIAWVGGPLSVSTNRLRHEGYSEALMRAGMTPNRDVIEVPATEEGGRTAFDRLAKMNPHPDAVFCASDPIAIGIIEGCKEHGIKVPEDLAIVGYADLHYSSLLKVALTTVRQPRQLLGERAAELLLRKMEGGSCSETQPLPVELIVRQSTVPQASEEDTNGHKLIKW